MTCQDACPPVPATPPSDLLCLPEQAILHHIDENDCCLFWICPQILRQGNLASRVLLFVLMIFIYFLFKISDGSPPIQFGFPGLPNQGQIMQNEVMVQVIEPLDEHTVRLAFSVPTLLVGLHGRVEVRYTATKQ